MTNKKVKLQNRARKTLLNSLMPRLRTLSSVFRAAAKTTPVTSRTAKQTAKTTTKTETKSVNDATLKQFVSSIDTSSSSSSFISHSITRSSKKSPKPGPPTTLPPSNYKRTLSSPTTHSVLPELNLERSNSDSESESKLLSRDISSIFYDGSSVISPDSQETGSEKSPETDLHIPWLQKLSPEKVTLKKKEVCRSRKQTWIFKSTQKLRFNHLFTMIDRKVGAEAILDLFGKLGRATGAKEFTALIELYIKKARESDDEDVALKKISIAFEILKLMKDEGFRIDEEAYGPFLMYLIDMGMVEEFKMLCAAIEDDDPTSHARLGYYKMLMYIGVDDEENIRYLCSYIANSDVHETSDLRENYLLALCKRDRKAELSQLLETIDITKISSLDHKISIFNSLGRLLFDSLAKKFLLVLKESDSGTKDISTLVFSYATSIPNLAVEDAILTFKNLHSMLEIAPSSASYEKVIKYCCDSREVHAALDMVHQMCREGLSLSTDMINSVLHACEESFEFNLVQDIYSLICCHKLSPNNETFRSMISLRVKMKDYAGAYDMLDDLKKFNLTPAASMYNAIMAGCFREKKINGGLMVLKKMELAAVKPDSQTYSYLIANCNSEDKISKYYEELKYDGVQVTKQIFMALINAYATCGQFEKAKQVLLDEGIAIKSLNEIESALVSALASHGQISDALGIYEEIKKAGGHVEPKTVLYLIDHFQSEGEASRLLKLLEDLQGPDDWLDGRCKAILWCIRNKHLSSAVNLLKQLKERYWIDDELAMQVIFDEVFSLIAEIEPTDLQIGLDLLQAIKAEFCIPVSRQSLDFLLSACAKAKDPHQAVLIWQEYEAAGYPYNVINYLRMYQTLLASGDRKSAKTMLAKIPKDDPHVCRMIQAYQRTYVQSNSSKRKKVKRKGKK